MAERNMPSFRIGLAMAGAVSAGAYTAGVLDFLLEALDAWSAAKARGEAVPQHGISLEVASGASAGAMCAALLAIVLPHRFPHVRIGADGSVDTRGGGEPALNPLYRAWVQQIDIDALLEPSDLEQGRLESLLNCDVIDRILRDSLNYPGPPQPRDYIRRPFKLRFTLGNLRGVPYRIDFLGTRQVSEEAMIEHADYQEFLIGRDSDGNLPAGGLEAVSISDAQGWQGLGTAALASGAFPLFLRPRLIRRDPADYAARHFMQASQPQQPRPIEPAWREPGLGPQPYAFASVDGGVFNNEPFELAHEVIAGGPGKANPGQAELAEAAVLMLDPFMGIPGDGTPPRTVKDAAGAERLLLPPEAQLMPLVYAWIMQSRFKPADLALAYDETVYSRFLIAPYGSKSPDQAPYWIASGALGGFLGFFHEDFRKHDYQLGRRNCQQFLREHFTLPDNNVVMQAGYAALRGQPQLLDGFRSQDGQLQIIPLLEALRPDEGLMDWPAGRFQVAQVMPRVAQRLDAVFVYYRDRIAADATGSSLLRWACRLGLSAIWKLAGRRQLCDRIAAMLQQARTAQQL